MANHASMSDLDLENILSTPYELPHAVLVILRKVEFAEMDRAKRVIAEKLRVILNNVNMAMSRMRMANAVVEEEADLNLEEEKKKRAEQLLFIKDFVQSSLDKELELKAVLQWLTGIYQELDEDEEFEEVKEITVKWIVHIEQNIKLSIDEVQNCVDRLHQLCGKLFDLDNPKTKKKEAAFHKGGVWRWWRETKVDAKTILRIQEFQPPSVERILSDMNLASRSTLELSFMLGDMAKLLSCNKVMSMAFKFVQTGLNNLNETVQEGARENLRVVTQLQELKSSDCQVRLENAKAELDAVKQRFNRSEADKLALKEENMAHVFQIKKLNETISGWVGKPHFEEEEGVEQLSLALPKLTTQTKQPPLTKKQKPKEVLEMANSMQCKVSSELEPGPEVERNIMQKGTYDENKPRKDPELFAQSKDTFESLERISSNLMDIFQQSVFAIIDRFLNNSKHSESTGEVDSKSQSMGLEQNSTIDAMKLFMLLENIIKNAFTKWNSNLHSKFANSSLGMPFAENTQSQVGHWKDNGKSPRELLQDVNRMFTVQDTEMKSMDSSIHNLIEDQDKDGNSMLEFVNRLKCINDISKQQASKMHQAYDGLVEIHQKIHKKPFKERGRMVSPGEERSSTRSMSTSSVQPEGKEIELKKHRSVMRPAKVVKNRRSFALPKHNVLKTKRKEGTSMKEDLARYKMDMKEEALRIKQTIMLGITFHMNMESQKMNSSLLRQAVLNGDISTELHSMAKETVNTTRAINEAKLACFFRKFVALRSLQQVRYNLNMQLLAARELNEGMTVRNIYYFLLRLDVYENRVMGRWKTRQDAIQNARSLSLANIVYLFNEIREDCCVNLLLPVPISSKSECSLLTIKTHKLMMSHKPCKRQRPHTHQTNRCLAYPAMPDSDFGLLAGDKLTDHLPSLWTCNMTSSNMHLGTKVPVGPITVPSIPLLMEMDINNGRAAALRAAHSRLRRGQLHLARDL